jgi:hypothetical protein
MRRPTRQKLKILPKAIIVCEGKVTEVIYFEGVRITRRIPTSRVVVHSAAGRPKQIVDEAVRLRKQNDALNRSQGLEVADTVWAVFDKDDHPLIPEAKQKAKKNNIGLAFSNPNFELFLLSHFEQLNREENRDVVTRLLRKHIPDYKKSFDYEELEMHQRYLEAKKRLDIVNRRSTVVAGIERAPFCCVHHLVDFLRSL